MHKSRGKVKKVSNEINELSFLFLNDIKGLAVGGPAIGAVSQTIDLTPSLRSSTRPRTGKFRKTGLILDNP